MARTTLNQLVPIQKIDVFRQVLSRIETYIRENELQPGDRLPSDRDLAEMLGVSRPSVRQAVKVLEGLGRLEVHHGSGTFVGAPGYAASIAQLTHGLTLDRQYLRHLESARNAIEVQVMLEAFERRTPEGIEHVRQSIEATERALGEFPDQATLVLGFESALGDICGNEPLRRLQALAHELWIKAELETGTTFGDERTYHEEHVMIFDHFLAGDLKGALDIFREHLSNVPPAEK